MNDESKGWVGLSILALPNRDSIPAAVSLVTQAMHIAGPVESGSLRRSSQSIADSEATIENTVLAIENASQSSRGGMDSAIALDSSKIVLRISRSFFNPDIRIHEPDGPSRLVGRFELSLINQEDAMATSLACLDAVQRLASMPGTLVAAYVPIAEFTPTPASRAAAQLASNLARLTGVTIGQRGLPPPSLYSWYGARYREFIGKWPTRNLRIVCGDAGCSVSLEPSGISNLGDYGSALLATHWELWDMGLVGDWTFADEPTWARWPPEGPQNDISDWGRDDDVEQPRHEAVTFGFVEGTTYDAVVVGDGNSKGWESACRDAVEQALRRTQASVSRVGGGHIVALNASRLEIRHLSGRPAELLATSMGPAVHAIDHASGHLTLRGDDPDMALFNDYLLILEALQATGQVHVFDLLRGEWVEPP